MDVRLRILLRQYLASGDPNDAVAFANNAVRSAEDLDATVWVVQAQVDPDGSDLIALFISEETAIKYAAEIVANALEDELLALGNEEPAEWMITFLDLYKAGYLVDAYRGIDGTPLYDGTDTDCIPEIHIYQEDVRFDG